jgi:ABC-2 type transport system permease protein
MSAITRPGLAPSPVIPAPATVAGPVSQVRVVRAEWTKLRALRSTWWCTLVAVVLIVGVGALVAGSGTAYQVLRGYRRRCWAC